MKYKCKLKNKCNKMFIRSQITFVGEKSKERIEKPKDINHKPSQIK